MDDRRRRDLNIVIYNLSEGTSTNGIENKQFDENNLKNISIVLGLENLQIETSFRLGKKESGRQRVLKVVLSDRKQRKFLLDNSRNISHKVEDRFKNNVTFKDLTIDQRKERKQKREMKDQLKGKILLNPPSDTTNYSGHQTHMLSQQTEDPFNEDTMIVTTHTHTLVSELNDSTNDITVIGGIAQSITEENRRKSDSQKEQQCEHGVF